jgi:hypothetical protein
VSHRRTPRLVGAYTPGDPSQKRGKDAAIPSVRPSGVCRPARARCRQRVDHGLGGRRARLHELMVFTCPCPARSRAYGFRTGRGWRLSRSSAAARQVLHLSLPDPGAVLRAPGVRYWTKRRALVTIAAAQDCGQQAWGLVREGTAVGGPTVSAESRVSFGGASCPSASASRLSLSPDRRHLPHCRRARGGSFPCGAAGKNRRGSVGEAGAGLRRFAEPRKGRR